MTPPPHERDTMYIWKIKVEEKWSYEPKAWQWSDCDYTVSAKTIEDAWKKVKPLVVGKTFEDEDEGKKYVCTDARIIFAERGAQLDA